jgi:two-component system response regulator MtrA
MSVGSAEDFDEQPVILCVTTSRSKRVQVARLMGGCGTVLMFPDLKSLHRVLFSETEMTTCTVPVAGKVALGLGRLVVDTDRQQVSWAGKALPLTRIEREVLAALASPPLRVWTYRQLYERVWRADYLDDASAIRSTVKRLRAKLRGANVPLMVEAMRGVGFSLVDTGSADEASAAVGDRGESGFGPGGGGAGGQVWTVLDGDDQAPVPFPRGRRDTAGRVPGYSVGRDRCGRGAGV